MAYIAATRNRRVAGLAVLALGLAVAHAEERGRVYLLVNPEAPRAEWQRRPVPGAFVALSWTLTIPAPGHAVSTCRYSELARTDAAGEYVIDGPDPVTAGLGSVAYFVSLALSKRAPAQRLSHISLFTYPGCADAKLSDPRALLVPYLQAVLDEARALNIDSDRGRQDVAHIEAALAVPPARTVRSR